LCIFSANGIEEMIDFFNSGRIMYGLCRVKIKDRNIEKIALINWVGKQYALVLNLKLTNFLILLLFLNYSKAKGHRWLGKVHVRIT